jgi:regulator of sigma E protease
MSFAIAVGGLALLILIHEAGHFFTALAVGMRPRRFYIFFPPAIAKYNYRGVEYGIGSIPLGGYVKIPGMHRPAASDLDAHLGRALEEAPQLVGPLERVKGRLNAGDFEGAREQVPELESSLAEAEVAPGRRRLAERGLTDLRDALAPDAYWRARTWKRVAVIFAGPATNLVVALALFVGVFMLGYGKTGTTVLMVQKGHPAALAGIRHGDQIKAVDGHPVDAESVRRRIVDSGGKPLLVTVKRDGRLVTIGPVAPRLENDVYRLGVGLGRPLGFAASVGASVTLVKDYAVGVVRVFTHRFTSEGRKQLSGPVGIVKVSSDAYRSGGPAYASILALISLSLALLNLLPLLPLDGGHILFSLIEGIRGRAVGREVYERVSAIGIAFGAIFFFLALSNDVTRLGG